MIASPPDAPARPLSTSLLTAIAVVPALVSLSGAAWYLAQAFAITAPGFPLDDTWIHLQFARNLANGAGFSFNPGVHSAGSTAPLWTIVLAVPLAAGLDAYWSATIIGTLAAAATAAGATVLVHLLTRSMAGALLGGLAVALSPRMTWASVSGMEVALYAALVTWTFVAYLKAQSSGRAWWGLLAGLAGCARPETFVVAPLLALHWLWRGGRRPNGRLQPGWWVPLAAFAAVAAGFVCINLYAGGRPLPTTFYAKSYGMGTFLSLVEGRPEDAWEAAVDYPLEFVNTLLLWSHGQSAFFFLTLLVGALAMSGVLGPPLQGAGPLVLVFLIAPAAKGLIAPQPPLLVHDGRYIAHLLVLFFVIAAVGYVELQRRARLRWVVPLLALVTLARLASQDVKFASEYAAQVENINDLQVRTAHWIVEHTSPEARIATNDIGAIGFMSGRFIIDTEGLVTPEAIHPKRMKQLLPFLESVKPDLLIIFPQWYPYLAVRTDIFEEIGRISAPQVVAGAESLVIYRMPWTREDVVRAGIAGQASAISH